MRNSKDRWTFFQHSTKPTLSAAEVTYWRNTLRRILKVGKEFEFNLPKQKGTCKGDNSACACTHLTNGSDCWSSCLNTTTCIVTQEFHRCANVKEKCDPEECKTCNNYKLTCPGIFCSDFVSKCFDVDCPDFKIACNKCPEKFDPKTTPAEIRRQIEMELVPSHCYGIVSSCGVHSITQDGSLLGDNGVEIVTVGRRVDYWEFYRMSKKIIEAAVSRGGYVNERCSIHMHLLASYYGKVADTKKKDRFPTGVPENISELEKCMPQIILANFHQLCRRYQNAITWMTMALDYPLHMTRWEKFRVSVLEFSAALNSMRDVKNKIYDNSDNNKYGWVDYNFCKFDKEDNLRRFHVEMRTADGMLSPSAVAALGCLFYAMAIKAVEISRYGILEVGDKDWMERTMKIKEAILNNRKHYKDGDRFGYTKNLPKYYDILKTESFELIRQLKHILIRVGPAYKVLEKLGDRPIALRRCDGETWETIEKDLEVPSSHESTFETKLTEYIDLRLIDECRTVEEWVEAVAHAMKSDPETSSFEDIDDRIIEYVETKRNEGDLVWSDSLGAVVLI